MSAFTKKPVAGPSPLLLTVGALLAVLLVFLLLPLASRVTEQEKPDTTVRDVDLIALPKPPEEEETVAEEAVAETESALSPELSAETEAVELSPLAVEGSGPPMPMANTGDLAMPEFPLANAPSAMPEVFALNEVDVRPVPLVQKPPVYPWELRRSRVEGEAVMRFIVDAEGRVGDIEVESATHESFGQASIEAIRQWRYKPAQKDGKPVACTVRTPMPFKLR